MTLEVDADMAIDELRELMSMYEVLAGNVQEMLNLPGIDHTLHEFANLQHQVNQIRQCHALGYSGAGSILKIQIYMASISSSE